jgi:hypothetical protein
MKVTTVSQLYRSSCSPRACKFYYFNIRLDEVSARSRHVDYGFQLAASHIFGEKGHECVLRILNEFHFHIVFELFWQNIELKNGFVVIKDNQRVEYVGKRRGK